MLRKEVVETRAQNGSESTYRNEELYRIPEVDLNAVPVSDLDQEWKTLETSGMIQAEAAVHLANIARGRKKEGRIGEALAMARLAYLYGPEDDKAVYLTLFADLLEENGEMEKAAEARVALEKLRQKEGGEGE
ncbi:MAG: hypothetical protein D3904_12685 [Candidatus Electrothrix sp. EH2]|nr:hypothetical protein [Candidatus Electrothrix sp. EH2]